jgi:hypothetical protein
MHTEAGLLATSAASTADVLAETILTLTLNRPAQLRCLSGCVTVACALLRAICVWTQSRAHEELFCYTLLFNLTLTPTLTEPDRQT